MNESSKLYAAQGKYLAVEKGAGSAGHSDDELDAKRHDRLYNPIDDAEKAQISSKLNEDSGRYRKGPGPV